MVVAMGVLFIRHRLPRSVSGVYYGLLLVWGFLFLGLATGSGKAQVSYFVRHIRGKPTTRYIILMCVLGGNRVSLANFKGVARGGKGFK